MTPAEFFAKWQPVDLTERSASQQHFLDLCELVGHPKPVEVDKTGESFCFERGAAKHGGGDGWADVWKKDFFGWEYKGKRKDLAAAYDQLLKYRADLENPPLLVVCDMDRIVVHTNFSRAKEQVFEIPLAALDTPRNLEILRAVFHDPDKLKPGEPSRAITEHAAAHLGELAAIMGKRGLEPHAVAHYLIRLVFCLFAEDVDLLPRGLFADIVKKGSNDPARFSRMVAQLFSAMASGGEFGADVIKHFNGNLFADAAVLDLTRDEIERVAAAAALEWNTVDASIFGTLFTRGIDPQQRSQLGAQYTSRADIETIVEPVVMTPLRREWTEVRGKAEAMLAPVAAVSDRRMIALAGSGDIPVAESSSGDKDVAPPSYPAVGDRRYSPAAAKKNRASAEKLLTAFLERLKRIRVLDPAGGSGNFLYVTLQKLLDLEKEVNDYLAAHGFTPLFPHVNPSQLFLIEINTYAHSLAQVTVQIGYIQWLRAHGYGFPAEPILLRLDKNFLQADSLFTDWPEVDFIVSNPPFLGDKFMRGQLGDEYVEKLRDKFKDSVPGGADFCCFWFEKARAHIEAGKVKRAGLLATQGIRGGKNREVLKRIKETGDIFFAESDRDWILDGANVHISMVGFDDGRETNRQLDGKSVSVINANLTSVADITAAQKIKQNAGICHVGTTKKGPLDIDEQLALAMLAAPNPNGAPNSDVVVPYLNAMDIVSRPSKTWIIDFPVHLSLDEVSKYEKPFEYVKTNVLPLRVNHREPVQQRFWWRLARPCPDLKEAVLKHGRYLVTPQVSKHRIFAWIGGAVNPDHQLFAFARNDDYFFGVLQSRAHEQWALKLGTRLETRPRYTPTTCFETFPFPAATAEQQAAIASAAKELNELRERWLNPPEWTREEVLEFPASAAGPWARFVQNGVARYPRLVAKDADCAKQLTKRTLTNLYNERPTWLANAHAKLDAAVFAAYGWPADLTDDQILEKLLVLNLERAKG